LNHGLRGWARIKTKQVGAWASQAALRFQILSQASLHGILKTHRSSRSASGPAFRALREINILPIIGIQKKHGARLACRDGGVFETTSASLLARGFAKRPLHSRSEYTPVIFMLPHPC
jgi:hypothetical protein